MKICNLYTILALTLAIFAIYAFAFPDFALADLNADREKYALEASKGLYCDVFNLLSGNFGVLLGFCLAAAGFFVIITSGVSTGSMVMIFMGIILTAIPGFFEAILEGVSPVLSKFQGEYTDKEGNKKKSGSFQSKKSGYEGICL